MTHLSAIILGFIEGATEFIPVSSSGHLIVVREFLGVGVDVGANAGLAFDAVLQLAASCALLVYFHRDVWKLLVTGWRVVTQQEVREVDKSLLFAVVLGTVPAVFFGFLLEDKMETVFRSSTLVAVMLIVGSVLMFGAEWWSRRRGRADVDPESSTVTVRKGIVVGLFQSLALVPGISRSGATISGGLFSGLSQNDATRFSFVLSLPILFGAGLKKLFELRADLVADTHFTSLLLLGSVTAFIVGLISINFLIKYLKTHNLTIFIWYRILLAILIFIII